MLIHIWNSTKLVAWVLEKYPAELLGDNIIGLSLWKLDFMFKEKQIKKEMQNQEIKLYPFMYVPNY